MSYKHVYNLKSLMEKNLCRIVFVDDYEAALDLKAFFEEQNPKYVSQINKCFLPYRKVGPFKFKNKKTVFRSLYKAHDVKDWYIKEGGAVNGKLYQM